MERLPSAIEAARTYGVDIEQLMSFWRLTPLERLYQLQAMVDFVVTIHEHIHRQKEQTKHERTNRISETNPVVG